MKRKTIISIICLFSFVLILSGISYAYFIEKNEIVDVALSTGEMKITYTNGSDLSIDNAIPLNDNLGRITPYYVEFSITGITDTDDIYYEIDLIPKNGNTINSQYVKTYLTDQNDVGLTGICFFDMLKDSLYNNGKNIYSKALLHNTNNTKKTTTNNYRLRIWLDESYMGNTRENFSFDIKIYAKNVSVNLMNSFSTDIGNNKANIKEIYFENDTRENIDRDYNAATIKADLTYNNYGNVKAWLIPDTTDNTKYIMYVKSDGETYFNNGNSLFFGYGMEKIVFSNINTSLITNMTLMFYSCNKLKNLDLKSFNTGNVTIMNQTFNGCSSMTDLDIRYFNTIKCTNMHSMFYNCTSLENLLGLNYFDTYNVVADMQSMFYNLNKITELDLSSFDTVKVNGMRAIFYRCGKLVTIYVSDKWSIVSVGDDVSGMFQGCNMLVGEKGTVYSAEHMDGEYARVDDPDNDKPGYFTYKSRHVINNSSS